LENNRNLLNLSEFLEIEKILNKYFLTGIGIKFYVV